MIRRKCLVVSTFNLERMPWSGVLWEFANVISQIEDTEVVAPENRFRQDNNPDAMPPLRKRIIPKIRGLRLPRMEPVNVERDYDLAFYVCQFSQQLAEMSQIRNWRSRAKKSAVFILEGWPAKFKLHARTLAALDQFDHVFVLNGSSIPDLARYTSTPISQLSTATDLLVTTPITDNVPRVVDICCIGRNDPAAHAKLLDYCRERGLFYHYDVWRNLHVKDGWDAVRRFNADLIRRSRYYIVWDPAHGAASRPGADGSQVLSTRYFEGAAGGAVLLGSRPDCPEYHAAFDWSEAVIPLGDDPGSVISMLDSDPQRVERIKANNIRQSLLRHDWAHRWRQVLETLDLEPTPQHLAREEMLASLSMTVDVQSYSPDAPTLLRESS